jgi:hypothetical protein
MAILKRVCHDSPRPIRELIPEIPEWLCALIARLHAKRPEERFQSAAEVAELLEMHQPAVRPHGEGLPAADRAAPGKAAQTLTLEPKSVAPRRVAWRRWVAVVLVLAAGLGVLGLVGWTGLATELFRPQWRPVRVREGASMAARSMADRGDPGQADGRASQDGKTKGPAVKSGEKGNADRKEVLPVARGGPEWVRLFDGEQLTGWDLVRSRNSWKFLKGVLIGSGPGEQLLRSYRNDYENFHLRVEVKVSARANSGVYFRGAPNKPGAYEAQIYGGDEQDNPSGTLSAMWVWPNRKVLAPIPKALVPPDTWFVQEVIAQGDHILVRVNDTTVADVRDSSFARGGLALECPLPPGVVQFRKIEIREFPPGAGPRPAAP